VSNGQWDGTPRRKTDFGDNGEAAVAVVLARIDERVNTLISSALEVRKELEEHKKDDDRKFDNINHTIWWAGGAVACLLAVIDIIFKR